jgi:SAM-dependent methyltransferase/uncharacterized protein YbaR (Trm112 family)
MTDPAPAPFDPKSRLMKLLLRLGLVRLAWSLRRFHVPVSEDALVLEVGSGGNPYFRANVLLDAYQDTRERHFAPLVADRPTVLGLVENLPFKDSSFDFVIASHVLEHSARPEQFLGELMRVAKAGYIEVPDALMERLNPYLDHRLEITDRGGALVIRKKAAWQADPELAELYAAKGGNDVIAGHSIPRNPFTFHVRHYWSGRIEFRVLNPDTDAEWAAQTETPAHPRPSLRARLQGFILGLARRYLSQNRRNAALDILPLLQCPTCRSGSLVATDGQHLTCRGCGARYSRADGIAQLFADTAAG